MLSECRGLAGEASGQNGEVIVTMAEDRFYSIKVIKGWTLVFEGLRYNSLLYGGQANWLI